VHGKRSGTAVRLGVPLLWQRSMLLLALTLLVLGCRGPACATGIPPGGLAELRKTFIFADPYGSDIAISYLDTGGQADTAIVFIHGFGGSCYTWHAILPALAEQYRVIAVDLKGFGESGKPDDRHYSVFDQAVIVDGLIKHLGLRAVMLGGHSMGGMVSLALAADLEEGCPYTIDRLILFGTPAFRQRLPLFIMALDIPFVGEAILHVVPPATLVRLVLEASYYDDNLIDDDEIEAYAQGIRSPGGRRALVRTARALADLNESGYTFDFDRLRMPALLIWGKHDTVVPVGYAFALRDALPGPVSFYTLDRCGHIPPTERPEEVLRLTTEFLKHF
jgi:pimeloyl-ACP methyl ester carboxylesterase